MTEMEAPKDDASQSDADKVMTDANDQSAVAGDDTNDETPAPEPTVPKEETVDDQKEETPAAEPVAVEPVVSEKEEPLEAASEMAEKEPAADTVEDSKQDISMITAESASPNREDSKRLRSKSRSRRRRDEDDDEETYDSLRSDGVMTRAMDRVVDLFSPADDDNEEYTVFSNDTDRRREPSMQAKIMDSLDKHVLTRFGCSHPTYGDQTVENESFDEESTVQTRSVAPSAASPPRSRKGVEPIPEDDGVTYDDPPVALKELDEEAGSEASFDQKKGGLFLCGALQGAEKEDGDKTKEAPETSVEEEKKEDEAAKEDQMYSPSQLDQPSPSFDEGSEKQEEKETTFLQSVTTSIMSAVFPSNADDTNLAAVGDDINKEPENTEDTTGVEANTDTVSEAEAKESSPNPEEDTPVESTPETEEEIEIEVAAEEAKGEAEAPEPAPLDEGPVKEEAKAEDNPVIDAQATLQMPVAPAKKKKKKSFLKRVFSKKSKKKGNSKPGESLGEESQPLAASVADHSGHVSGTPAQEKKTTKEVDKSLISEKQPQVVNPMDPEQSTKAKREAWKTSKALSAKEDEGFGMIMSKNAANDDWGDFSPKTESEDTPKKENKATKFETPTKDSNGFAPSLFSSSSPAHVTDFPAE